MARPLLADVPSGRVECLFRWSCRQELGRGTFGIVYKATCTKSSSLGGFAGISAGTKYAVKAVLKDNDVMGDLYREMTTLRDLHCPHLIQIYYAFQDSSTVYLVEELFEGKELFNVVQEKGRVAEWVAADVARQLLEG
eukprot:RCo009401